jgi:hypothetical protein
MQSGSHCCQRLPLPEARHTVNIGCEFTVVTRPVFFESSSEHPKKNHQRTGMDGEKQKSCSVQVNQ